MCQHGACNDGPLGDGLCESCEAGWQGDLCNVEADRCATDNGGCEQTCISLPGGRECACASGYSLNSNGTSCDSTNAAISALSVYPVALSPDFDPAVASYTAAVTNGAKLVSVTAAAVDAGAAIEINGQVVASGQPSGSLPLTFGENVVTVRVVAADGVTANEITIHITKPSWNVLAVARGVYEACVLRDDGKIKCWGGNGWGQLGLGDTNPRGDGPGEMGNNLPTVNVGTGRTVKSISANNGVVCAVLDNNSLKCWGDNFEGRLGLADTNRRGDAPNEMGDNLPAVSLGTGRTALSVSVGEHHVCALLDNSAVKCWGQNDKGELGVGTTARLGDQAGEMGDALPAVSLGSMSTPIAVIAGSYNSCALLADHTVKCWGSGNVLGLGTTNNRGDGASEMGDFLPVVDLGTSRFVRKLTADSYTKCAILDDGALKCWGQSDNGALGIGEIGTRGDAPGEMGDDLPAVNVGTGRSIVQLGNGFCYACALLDNGAVKCWGLNANGQLGLGDTMNRGAATADMGDALSAVDLGTGRTAVKLFTETFNSCVLLDDGTVKCWGRNLLGALGLGDTRDRGINPSDMGDNLPPIELGD